MPDGEMADDGGFDPSEYGLTIERTFDAPREAVWEAWTEPDQVAAWWGPEHFTVPHCELDVRPGGDFHISMEALDGTVYPDAGFFEEVVEPERLVIISQVFEDDDGDYQLEVRHTARLEDRGEQTGFRFESEVISATRDVAVHLDGMEQGWTESFEKLEAYLEGED